MDMLLPDPKALPYVKDLQWLGKIRMAAKARYREEHFDLKHCGEKVKALISEYIGADEMTRLLEPVSILSTRFDEEVERLVRPEAKASEMEHALRHEIKVRYEDNPVLYQSLKEYLERIIADRKAERLSQAEELKQLASLFDEIRGMRSFIQEMGLTPTSFPIYELVLTHRDQADGGLSKVAEVTALYHTQVDEPAKSLATALEEDITTLAVIDWTTKDDVQREMRRRIKRRLRGDGFSAESSEAAATEILDVARRTLT